MTTSARQRRKKIYHRASAIARDIRTADFPDAVNIVARLIAGPMSRRKVRPSTDVVMIEGALPVFAPLALELAKDNIIAARVTGENVRTVECDSDCPRRNASWPGCCKLNERVDMSDVFEPAGPDSFGGEDGMHSPAAATIRAEASPGQDSARAAGQRRGSAAAAAPFGQL